MPINDDIKTAMDGEPAGQSFPVQLMFEILHTIRSKITVVGSTVGVAMGPVSSGNYVEKYLSQRGLELQLMKSVGMVQDVIATFGISNSRSGFPVSVWFLGVSDTCYNRRELLSFMRRCLRTPGVSLSLMAGLVDGNGGLIIQDPPTNSRYSDNEPVVAEVMSDTAPAGPTMLNW
jgi:hypothetical protein